MRDLLDKLDAIAEASVFKTKNSQYVPGHRLGVSTSKQGAKTLELIQKQVPDFDGAEVLTISNPDDRPRYEVTISPGELSYMITRPNGDVIKLLGSKSAIEQTFNDLGKAPDPSDEKATPKLPNKGDTAEGLLGAALFAKLLKRQGDDIGQITTDDVWDIFDNLNPVTENDYMVTSKDMGGATDTIWFKLKVKNTVKRALEEPALRKSITNWMLSPVNYVNSPEGTDYAAEFYKNGTPDEIGVISDGLSAQKDKKTDVVTAVRDPGTNKIKREVMPVSLKAGADQFAQHSGGKWQAMETMFSLLGVDLSSVANLASEYEGYQKRGEQIKAASDVYKTAATLLNKQFTDDASEAQFIQTVAKALRFWATNDDDQVYLVSFGSRGKYDVLQFSLASLIPAMKQLKLRARFVPGDNPKIEVYDEVSGQLLFGIRTYMQSQEKGFYQRNVIEKGPLMGKIADATGRYRDRPKELPAQKPVATARPAPRASGQTPDQQQGGLIDVANDQQPVGKLTGPAAKTVQRPVEAKTDLATLGRELRRR